MTAFSALGLYSMLRRVTPHHRRLLYQCQGLHHPRLHRHWLQCRVSGCFREHFEYGNTDKGSYAWSTLVGLHCGPSCLHDTVAQSWFPEDAATCEVRYCTAEQCQRACQSIGSCEHFVFDANPGMFEGACWMKSD